MAISWTRSLAAVLLAAPLLPAQQTVVLDEDFAGLFPPAGWSVQPAGWSDGGVAGQWGTAFHNDNAAAPGTTNDDLLVTPAMDLGAMSVAALEFSNRVRWANFMAHHPLGAGDGESHVVASTDGGATWTTLWSEARLQDGVETTSVDLAGQVGASSVLLAFRYRGNGAHEWTVDDVTIGGVAPLSPTLSSSGDCPGFVVVTAAGCSPGGTVIFGWSAATGSAVVPVGSCAGVISGLGGTPQLLGIGFATSGGQASLLVSMPAASCGGMYVQALDKASCGPSDVLLL